MEDLLEVAERLKVPVRREHVDLSEERTWRGGVCLIEGSPVIFVNTRLSDEEQIAVLAESLSGFLSDDVYLLPRTRLLIERYGAASSRKPAGNV